MGENTNRMRIICNPYLKTIEYQWYNSGMGEYVEINSKLSVPKYMNTTIQNRACEILDLIKEEYGSMGNIGLIISFVGTEDDYEYLRRIVDLHYKEDNIVCEKDEDYFNKASDIKDEIIGKVSSIEEILKSYEEKNEDIKESINKYKDTIKPSVSICVVGLYSSGKSAFINSLIGEELLPSESDPTTARVCKISYGEEYKIRYYVDDKKYEVSFNGDTYFGNCAIKKEMMAGIQPIRDICTEILYMNKFLAGINNDKEYNDGIGDIVEVQFPMRRTNLPVDRFDFVICDTPGSNSATNLEHLEALKGALDQQTNALPILVTTPDGLDAKDNEELLNLLKETGESLDTENAIILVNKADDKTPKDLEKKRKPRQDHALTRWNSAKILFFSSPMAIASKKNDPDNGEEWLDGEDGTMYDLYYKNKPKFVEDKKCLYKYNIVDRGKADFAGLLNDESEKAHLYWNSGLAFVEQEITEYAEKYAMYKKCQMASEFSGQAISCCVDSIKKTLKELNERAEKVKQLVGKEEKNLFQQIDDKKKKSTTEYNTFFQERLWDCFIGYIKTEELEEKVGQKKLKNDFENYWKKIQKDLRKENRYEAPGMIQSYVNGKYNECISRFCMRANEVISDFWGSSVEKFQKDCLKLISGSEVLTEDQKAIVREAIHNEYYMPPRVVTLNLRSGGILSKKKVFLFWGEKDTFNPEACARKYLKEFNDNVRKEINTIEKMNNDNFGLWVSRLSSILMGNIAAFNPDLKRYQGEMNKLSKEIVEKQESERRLSSIKDEIDRMLKLQEG